MKKLTALAAALALILMTACGQESTNQTLKMKPGQSDEEYVREKGTLVIGITDFAPMDFKEGDQWTGFDAELAENFAESIGVKAELKEIDWEQKEELLNAGSIDCVWNGMTMTKELQDSIACSEPYLSNAQVIVMPKEKLPQYQKAEDCQHLLFALEGGSAGEGIIQGMKYRYAPYPTQKEAMQSVHDGKADATAVDVIMASYYMGRGQEFSDLGFQISLNDEKICVGFRKGSNLAEKANAFLEESYQNQTIDSLALQYGIAGALLDENERGR